MGFFFVCSVRVINRCFNVSPSIWAKCMFFFELCFFFFSFCCCCCGYCLFLSRALFWTFIQINNKTGPIVCVCVCVLCALRKIKKKKRKDKWITHTHSAARRVYHHNVSCSIDRKTLDNSNIFVSFLLCFAKSSILCACQTNEILLWNWIFALCPVRKPKTNMICVYIEWACVSLEQNFVPVCMNWKVFGNVMVRHFATRLTFINKFNLF